jgi:branched-subunit amino acid aminotransferase/4-amino-4-deoxychorismate lyase
MRVWFNGEVLPAEAAQLNALSPAALHGAGAFETLFVDAGRPRFLSAHWQRLKTTCYALGLGHPPALQRVAEVFSHLADLECIETGRGRMSGHLRGKGACDWLLSLEPIADIKALLEPCRVDVPEPEDLGELYRTGGLSAYKTNAYFGYRLAREKALDNGWDDCLLAGNGQTFAETTCANFFVLLEGLGWCTPPLSSGCLPGIIRGQLLSSQAETGVAICERPIGLAELLQVQAAFISNAVVGVREVAELGPRQQLQLGHPDVQTLRGWIESAPSRPV